MIPMRMHISARQQKIIDKAIKDLAPYNKESVSEVVYYFEALDEYMNPKPDITYAYLESEYNCCDKKDCIKTALKQLSIKYPTEKIKERWFYHNGDHEKIDYCHICGRPLNEFLTWVRSEFEHHEANTRSRANLRSSRTAFELICILQSLPSADYKISEYSKHQLDLGNSIPIKEQSRELRDFVKRIERYAYFISAKLTYKAATFVLCG